MLISSHFQKPGIWISEDTELPRPNVCESCICPQHFTTRVASAVRHASILDGPLQTRTLPSCCRGHLLGNFLILPLSQMILASLHVKEYSGDNCCMCEWRDVD